VAFLRPTKKTGFLTSQTFKFHHLWLCSLKSIHLHLHSQQGPDLRQHNSISDLHSAGTARCIPFFGQNLMSRDFLKFQLHLLLHELLEWMNHFPNFTDVFIIYTAQLAAPHSNFALAHKFKSSETLWTDCIKHMIRPTSQCQYKLFIPLYLACAHAHTHTHTLYSCKCKMTMV
jgi:hypothetical protein